MMGGAGFHFHLLTYKLLIYQSKTIFKFQIPHSKFFYANRTFTSPPCLSR
jgi:hypothetical protein